MENPAEVVDQMDKKEEQLAKEVMDDKEEVNKELVPVLIKSTKPFL